MILREFSIIVVLCVSTMIIITTTIIILFRRHVSEERCVYWQFWEKLRFNRARLCYEHEPESVVENEKFKILWDYTI